MDSLSPNRLVWEKMGASGWALRVLRTGFRIVWQGPKPLLSRRPVVFPTPGLPTAVAVLDQEVESLLSKGAISQVLNCQTPGYYCRLFAVPKHTGGFRPVLDLSPLNRHLKHIKFKSETIQSVRKAIQYNDWAVSLDLSDAFFHVPVHSQDQKWLRFVWKNTTYQFNVLPFGLSQSPWAFTRMVRELVRWARERGTRMVSYMDDWLILASSRALCLRSLQLVQDQATALGFRVNLEKSDLIPSQQFSYLGLRFNTVAWTVQPSEEKCQALWAKILSLRSKKVCTARGMASLLGSIESMAETIPLGRVHKRPLQREVSQRFNPHQDGWNCSLRLGPWFLQATQVWLDFMPNPPPVPLTLPAPETRLFVDASTQGWGAHTTDLKVAGVWSPQECSLHINHLELLAVRKALEALQSRLPRGHLQVTSDNRSVVAHINHQGGTLSPTLSTKAENLLLWAQSEGWTLSACHLAGSKNVLADLLSRPTGLIPTEWTLSHSLLGRLWARWHRPMIDLFATSLNHRLPLYVSPVPDSCALDTDALSMDWSSLDVYAFPPFALLSKVLHKARQEGPRMILVAPMWPWARWFNQLLPLAHCPPLALEPRSQDLFQPHSHMVHTRPEVLNLHAWLLCGSHCRTGDCQRKQ